MAKTIDERVAETIGQQVLMILRMEIEMDALRNQLADLAPKNSPPDPPKDA